MKNYLAFFNNKKVILFSTGPDVIIESIWPNKKRKKFLKETSRTGFFAVSALNFSLFKGECPFGQHINIKKTLITFSELGKNEVASIPHLYWLNDHQLEKWKNWLINNPSVNLVTINCQLFNPQDYNYIQRGIKEIIECRGGHLHILLEGPKRKMLLGLKNISSSIHIAQKWLSINAQNHKECFFDGEKVSVRQNNNDSKIILLQKNIEAYKQFLKEQFFNSSSTLDF